MELKMFGISEGKRGNVSVGRSCRTHYRGENAYTQWNGYNMKGT
jgi:hypothetical protein